MTLETAKSNTDFKLEKRKRNLKKKKSKFISFFLLGNELKDINF